MCCSPYSYVQLYTHIDTLRLNGVVYEGNGVLNLSESECIKLCMDMTCDGYWYQATLCYPYDIVANCRMEGVTMIPCTDGYESVSCATSIITSSIQVPTVSLFETTHPPSMVPTLSPESNVPSFYDVNPVTSTDAITIEPSFETSYRTVSTSSLPGATTALNAVSSMAPHLTLSVHSGDSTLPLQQSLTKASADVYIILFAVASCVLFVFVAVCGALKCPAKSPPLGLTDPLCVPFENTVLMAGDNCNMSSDTGIYATIGDDPGGYDNVVCIPNVKYETPNRSVINNPAYDASNNDGSTES